MTPIAITFLVLAVVVVWGGLIASVLFLARQPERAEFPAGGTEDHRADAGPAERDT